MEGDGVSDQGHMMLTKPAANQLQEKLLGPRLAGLVDL